MKLKHKNRASILIVPYLLVLMVLRIPSASRQFGNIWELLNFEAPYFAVVFILILGETYLTQLWARASIKLALLLFVFAYYVSTCVLIALDAPFSFEIFFRLVPSGPYLLSFINTKNVILFTFIPIIFYYPLRISLASLFFALGLMCIANLTSFSSKGEMFSAMRRYSSSQALKTELSDLANAHPRSSYSSDFKFKSTLRIKQASRVNPPQDRAPVVLVVVESLSSVDLWPPNSQSVSLPRLAKRLSQASVYTNFFANATETENGLAAILTGYFPISFPAKRGSFAHDVGVLPSLIDEYSAIGFKTTFVTSAPATFLDKNIFLEEVGISELVDLTTLDRFNSHSRSVIGALPDSFLYQYGLERIEHILSKSDQGDILILETTSSHLPWTNPVDGSVGEEEQVWEYVDQQLDTFIQELVSRGWLSKIRLIVTGDHRKMTPITSAELDKWGLSSGSRIPLIILGKDVEAGHEFAQPLQQVDMLRDVKGLALGTVEASTEIAFIETRGSLNTFGISGPPPNLYVLDRSTNFMTGFPYFFNGSAISSPASNFPNRQSFEGLINMERAALENLVKLRHGERCGVLRPQTRNVSGQFAFEFFPNTSFDTLSRELAPSFKTLSKNLRIPHMQEFPQDQSFVAYIYGSILRDQAGLVKFKFSADDNVCLYIDQKLVLDLGASWAREPLETEAFMGAGLHSIEVHYEQKGGLGFLQTNMRDSKSLGWLSIKPASF